MTDLHERPESENDFLEQADEFESSGSKWKAGWEGQSLKVSDGNPSFLTVYPLEILQKLFGSTRKP
jgi:hypothetical protein